MTTFVEPSEVEELKVPFRRTKGLRFKENKNENNKGQ